jgi:hypothetical protein
MSSDFNVTAKRSLILPSNPSKLAGALDKFHTQTGA